MVPNRSSARKMSAPVGVELTVTETVLSATDLAGAGTGAVTCGSGGDGLGALLPPKVRKRIPAPTKITAARMRGAFNLRCAVVGVVGLVFWVCSSSFSMMGLGAGCDGFSTESEGLTACLLMDGAGDGVVFCGWMAGRSTEGAATVAAVHWSIAAGGGVSGVSPATVGLLSLLGDITAASTSADGWAAVGASA